MINKKLKNFLKRNLVKNFLLIFTGQGISSILMLISTVIVIKAVGSEQHGILIVTQTYALLFYGLVSFKTFQALIKFLAKARKEKNNEKIKMYIKWSFVLDIGSLIVMFIVGMLLQDPVIHLMRWPKEIKTYILIFLFSQLFYLQGTTIGVLRSYEKYNYVIKSQIISSIIRVVGYIGCFIISKTLFAFILFEIIASMVNYILLIVYTVKVLKEEKLMDFYKVKLRYDKEFISFNIFSNLTSTLDLPINQITQFIINRYLGFTANSVYNVFTKLGSIVNKLGDPINQIIYPEMSKKVVDGDFEGAKKLSHKLKLLMGFIFIIMTAGTLITYPLWFHYFISEPNKYIFAFVVYLAFISYSNAAMGTHNLFMSLGYVKYNIPILLIINSIYLVALFYMIQSLGLIGVISAYLIQAIGVVCVKEIILKKNNYKEYSLRRG